MIATAMPLFYLVLYKLLILEQELHSNDSV